MANPENVLIQSCSNYKRYDAFMSRLRYARLPLNNYAGNTVPFGASSNGLLEFKCPAKKGFNLGMSYISYSYTTPTPAANTVAVTFENNQDLASWAYFGTSSGVGLTDLNYVDRYTSIVMPMRISHQELDTRDQSSTLYINQSNIQNGGNCGNVLPFSLDGQWFNAQDPPNGNGQYFQAGSSIDPQYLYIGGSGAAGAAGIPVTRNRMLPLSCFKDTIIGANKVLAWPEDMYLRFNSQYANRLGFFTGNPQQPQNSNANLTVVSSPFTASISVTNIYLFLAMEENEILNAGLLSKINAGFHLPIPYVYPYRYNGTAGSSTQNISITITKQNGPKLKRMLYAPFNNNGSEAGVFAFDHSNANGSKIQSIQSALDARPLQDYPLNCIDLNFLATGSNQPLIPNASNTFSSTTSPFSDDYREMQKYLAGSCIPTYRSYQINWFFQDVFGLQGNLKSLNQAVDDQNINDGFILNSDHIYNLQMTTPALAGASSNTQGTQAAQVANAGTINHYFFALYEREIYITNNRIEFVGSNPVSSATV